MADSSTMAKISIKLSSGSNDRYAIPNTIQKKQIHEEEERRELRITDSLMDDSDSDSSSGSDDGGIDDKTRGYNDDQSSKISSHHMNNITNCNLTKEDGGNNCQTTPLQHYNLANDTLCDKSTAIRNNTTIVNNTSNKTNNLLDEEIANGKLSSPQPNEDLLDNDDDSLDNNVFAKRNSRRHSSDTFMSVYEDLATKRRTASLGSSKSQPIKVAQSNSSTRYTTNNTATGRRKQVKTLVTTALQTVAEGLVVSHNSCDGIGIWDVDTMPMSGNKRMSIENNSNNNNNHRRKSRRKSLNIRAELTLQEEECAALKEVSNLWLMMIVVSKFFSSLINIYDIRNWKRLKQR